MWGGWEEDVQEDEVIFVFREVGEEMGGGGGDCEGCTNGADRSIGR